jgi:predicted amidohydrolase YtcJ
VRIGLSNAFAPPGRLWRGAAALSVLSLLSEGALRGQAITGVSPELVSYPQLIVHSGKIVTVDDHSVTSKLGTITQAMAVRDGKILSVGASDSVVGLKGPATTMIDLKGRTVLPGLILTHEHPQDWVFRDEEILKDVLGDDIVFRFLRGTPAEQLKSLEPTIKAAVAAASPGQWIQISTYRGTEGERGASRDGLMARITKATLDRLAPNNPIVVGESPIVVNSVAISAFQKAFPDLTPLKAGGDRSAAVFLETGRGGSDLHRSLRTDVMAAGKTGALSELYRQMMSWWAGYGITTFGSALQAEQNWPAYAALDDRGEMPIRFGWSYGGPRIDDPHQIRAWASQVGRGSDHFWFIGARYAAGSGCSSLPPRPGFQPDRCEFAPGSETNQVLHNYIRHGLRIAAMHTIGDQDVDYYLDILEKASADGGYTLDDVRRITHTFDHMGMAPRPDQLDRIKKLGMIVGGADKRITRSEAQEYVEKYGERAAAWIVPRKSALDAGVMTTFEIDDPLNRTELNAFHMFESAVTRRGLDGKVFAKDQAIDKAAMLKVATIWGAYYMLRPDKLGSLESGKFADFIVLDRDLLALPDDQLHTVTVLMTSVGGRVVHLREPFASEIGLAPTGAQIKYGGRLAN